MDYRLIAHEIRKSQHQQQTEIIYRESLIPANVRAASLVDEIRNTFKRHNPQGARFRMPEGDLSSLQRYFAQYLEAEDRLTAFIEFTNIATRKLRTCMEGEPASIGGYLVFAEYQYGEETFLVVVLLSSKARARFDANMNLLEVATLDIDHVRHAARFRYTGLNENSSGAVQIVARASEGNFFKDFIDCETVTDSEVQANLLKTAISSWIDAEGLSDPEKEELMKGTYGYWRACKKSASTMTLEGLANALYPNAPDRFRAHMTDEGADLEGEFSPPRARHMRQFQKFSFSGQGLKFEYDRAIWHNKVRVNGSTLTIRNAPAELLEQIRDESA